MPASARTTRGIVMKKGQIVYDSDINDAITMYNDEIESSDKKKKK